MKKHISALLALSMVLLLSACGGQSQPQDSSGSLLSETPESSQSGSEQQSNQSDPTQELINSITAETAEAKGVCGVDLYWYYQDNVLVIKGTGEMTNYYEANGSSKDVPWYEVAKDIGKIIIDEGCTTISESAFTRCENVASVILPDTLTSIDDSAFAVCKNLVSIDFGSGLQTIGEQAFFRCGIESVTLPDSLTTIESEAFHACDELEEIEVPASVTFVGSYAFGGIDTVIFLGDAPEIHEMFATETGAYRGNPNIVYSGSGFEKYIEQYPDINWIKQ